MVCLQINRKRPLFIVPEPAVIRAAPDAARYRINNHAIVYLDQAKHSSAMRLDQNVPTASGWASSVKAMV